MMRLSVWLEFLSVEKKVHHDKKDHSDSVNEGPEAI
jgi:hypothetical protein